MQSSQSTAELSIRLKLAEINKSQTWLAAQIGVSPFYISRRMKGVQKFTVDDLDAIARVFKTDLAGLLATAKAVA